MPLLSLPQHPALPENPKFQRRYACFERLWHELKTRDLPPEVVDTLNAHVAPLRDTTQPLKAWNKARSRAQMRILSTLRKELKLVPPNHHTSEWMALGMSVFGVPFGVALGTGLDNMAFLGLGLPIGMAIGMAMGASMDQKAQKEERQLAWKPER